MGKSKRDMGKTKWDINNNTEAYTGRTHHGKDRMRRGCPACVEMDNPKQDIERFSSSNRKAYCSIYIDDDDDDDE